MPLPTPNDNEDQSAFFERCMSDLADEYTDESQRAAVCHRQWSGGDDESRENTRLRSTPIRQFSGSDIDLETIRRVAGNKELQPEQVYDFPKFVIARNGRNHNNTEITAEAQRAAEKGWINRPVYFEDHLTRASNQIARIYSAWVEDKNGETITMGRAYAVRTASDADLITKIQNGIHREMSCAYYPVKSECSVCKADVLDGDCPKHSHSQDYYVRDLAFKPDHVSFCGRPGVEGAGLVLNDRKPEFMLTLPGALTQEQRDTIVNGFKSMPSNTHVFVEDGKVFREWSRKEFARWYRLNNPSASQADADALAEKLSAAEMLRLAGIQERRYREVIPTGGQQLEPTKDHDLEAELSNQARTAEEIKQSLLKGKQ